MSALVDLALSSSVDAMDGIAAATRGSGGGCAAANGAVVVPPPATGTPTYLGESFMGTQEGADGRWTPPANGDAATADGVSCVDAVATAAGDSSGVTTSAS